MGNQFVRQAKKMVEKVKQSPYDVSYEDIEKVKNAISSAFANSTDAQREFLQTYRKELEAIEEQLRQ